MVPRKVALFLAGPLVAAGVLFSSGAFGSAAISAAPAARNILTTGAPAAAKQAGGTSALASAQAATTTINIAPGADTQSQILESVYQKVNPSVVEVVNLAQSARASTAGALPQGEGSGFVWDMQGHIVTNDHVVSGADKLQVVFADGTQVDAKLVGTDPNGDIAVIQVDPTLVNLAPVAVGNMSQVKVGETAIAIGNPFGFQGTMTRGIVSALGRTIPSQTTYSIPEAIQTDAAINPGNSGGPLLNEQGQVIGVNDQIQSASGSNSGVGFAIPISIVQRIVPSLIQNGTYQHSYLGLAGTTYGKAWAQPLGLPANLQGVYVEQVTPGSPAALAGLRAGSTDTSVLLGQGNSGPVYLQSGGDVITAVNGQSVTKMDDLLMYMEEQTSPGQTVKLTVVRSGGQSATLTVTLGTRPAQATS
jgi:serine protease Do